jgi:6-phosphogluconolactonase
MRPLIPRVSRRTFLVGLTAVGACSAIRAAGESSAAERPIRAYVGTDTTPVDGAANGKGLYLFEVDPATGELTLLKLAAETASPSWITLHPSGNYLYAVNEVSDYQGNSGSVIAFAVQKQTGDLRFLNTLSSQGAGPTHISVDGSGKFAFVANYYGGSIAVFPIRADGSLGPACCVHRDQGSLGSLHATSGPAGSFAISGHDAPHPHMILADPENRFVLQTDLGQDRIYVYRFDRQIGQLTPADTPFVNLPSGDGPRHFVFHPNGRWFYSIQEEASTVAFFQYGLGRLDHRQTISALPKGFTGTNFCSEIAVSSDGRLLYAANRLHNSIATFAIGNDGTLSYREDTATEGDYPNQMVIAPGGRFAYVCNQRSDQITSFRIDQCTGRLTFTGRYQPLGTPMCMAFLT